MSLKHYDLYLSGGCAIDIYGENLDNVPQPELLIYTDYRNFSTVSDKIFLIPKKTIYPLGFRLGKTT